MKFGLVSYNNDPSIEQDSPKTFKTTIHMPGKAAVCWGNMYINLNLNPPKKKQLSSCFYKKMLAFPMFFKLQHWRSLPCIIRRFVGEDTAGHCKDPHGPTSISFFMSGWLMFWSLLGSLKNPSAKVPWLCFRSPSIGNSPWSFMNRMVVSMWRKWWWKCYKTLHDGRRWWSN